MNSIKFIAVACLLMSATLLSAQESSNRSSDGKIIRGPYETNKFFDNWFMGVAGGMNVYTGEYDWKGDFGPRIAPAIDASVGKWITPTVAARVQYSGIQGRGWTTANNVFAREKDGKYYKQKFGYHFLHADALWNISNSFSGYKEDRTWDFIPYVGFGIARVHKEGYTNDKPAGVVGLLNNIRMSDRIDLTLEAKQMIVGQSFDGETGGSKLEGMSSITVGLSINVGKSNFKRVVYTKPDYTPYLKQINTLKNENNDLNAQNSTLQDKLKAAQSQIANTPKVSNAPMALFFTINKAELDNKELLNLDYYMQTQLKNLGSKKITIIGSADKETGTKEFNQKLSAQRAEYVAHILMKKYGIPSSQIVIKAIGDTDNQFKEPQMNRTVIMIE